jgi:3-deoxy-7-phosphoheptulonate synthase
VIINLSANASDDDIRRVLEVVRESGRKAHLRKGPDVASVVVTGAPMNGERETIRRVSSVRDIVEHDDPFQLVSRKAKPARTNVVVGDTVIGDGRLTVMAGPCSVESREQLLATAHAVKAAGATMLRGGAYKPRTSPYEFQGLGVEALRFLAEAREQTGLPVVTELMSTDDADLVCEYADMIQIGARNMQNFALLRRAAQCPRPVLLKRGPSATVKEWLMAAEYLLSGGNDQVVLCERGVKSFDSEATRNMLDIGAIALVRHLSHLPVIADPSHATGKRALVPAVSRAALAAGADGLMIEVHPCPERALSDGPQSLDFAQFQEMMGELR